MEARSCAFLDEAEEAVAASAGKVLSVTPTAKFFQNARKQRRYRRCES
jgi:hypothetical protein